MLNQEEDKKKDTKLQIRDPEAQVLRATMLETRDREGKREQCLKLGWARSLIVLHDTRPKKA